MGAVVPTPRPKTGLVEEDAETSGDFLAMLDVGSSDALPAWLAARLAALHPGSSVRVLRVYPLRAARIRGSPDPESFAVAADEKEQPSPAGNDPALLKVLASREPAWVRGDGGLRLLVPLAAGPMVRHVVDVRGAGEGDARQQMLLALARKYYERLVEGETDPLTRLANRRLFQEQVDAGLKRWTAPGRAYYFAMLDLDLFKRVNDDFGHLYGDEILVHFANLMRATFRSADQLFRFGGEEFVVIFGVDPPERGGEGTLERFRAAVEAYDFPGVGRVTVSIGYARAQPGTAAALLIDRADEALYYAKEHGRNRVCSWEALLEAGEVKSKAALKGGVTLFA
jgi:diguanylate cyclase (GGDEF)-like protein